MHIIYLKEIETTSWFTYTLWLGIFGLRHSFVLPRVHVCQILICDKRGELYKLALLETKHYLLDLFYKRFYYIDKKTTY